MTDIESVHRAILNGPDCPGKQFLIFHREQQTKTQQAKALKLVSGPAEVRPPLVYRCDHGHEFTEPGREGRLDVIGWCPRCLTDHGVRNPNYRRETTEEAVQRTMQAPLTHQEQAGKDMIEKIKTGQEKLEQGPPPGPHDDDLWDMKDVPLVKEEPGATESDEQDYPF